MGTLVLAGATSGSATLTPVDAVTAVITLPSATATLATLGANTFTGIQTVTAAGITAPTSALGNVFSGTYTPTVSNTTNVASSTPGTTSFCRVGNHVQVAGYIIIDPTSTGSTVFELDLPVASNFGTTGDCGGAMQSDGGITSGGLVTADDTTDKARFSWVAASAAAQSVTFTFGYRII